MERKAEIYLWSSASAYCQKIESDLLTTKPVWKRQLDSIEDWPSWLAEGDDSDALKILRRNADKGLPCGSKGFVEKLERGTGMGGRRSSKKGSVPFFLFSISVNTP